MKFCQVSTALAYVASAYIIASIVYLIITRSYGAPFKEAVNKHPELVEIKNESANKRKRAFYMGIGASIILLVLFRPFGKCW